MKLTTETLKRMIREELASMSGEKSAMDMALDFYHKKWPDLPRKDDEELVRLKDILKKKGMDDEKIADLLNKAFYTVQGREGDWEL